VPTNTKIGVSHRAGRPSTLRALKDLPHTDHPSRADFVGKDGIDISVVMPCLNEVGSVGTCVRKALLGIKRAGLRGEVVVVDNGSNDGSALAAARAGARVVEQPVRGYGSAYRKGFAAARGGVIVMGDADNSYDFTEIASLVAPIWEGADYVLGSRFRGQIEPGAMSWTHRYIGNPVLTGVLNALFKLESSDAHSGLRAFKREALERLNLRCDGMELASEIVVKAARSGLKVAEVPIVYHPRTGHSKLNALRDGWRHLRFLLLLSPLHVFVWPGLLLLAGGAAGEGAVVGVVRSSLGLRLSTLALGAMLLGLQLLVLGFFAKTQAYRSGFEPESAVSRFVEDDFTLERGLLASMLVGLLGALLVVAGVLGAAGAQALREELEATGVGGMLIGAQLAFCSFFLAFTNVPSQPVAPAIVLP